VLPDGVNIKIGNQSHLSGLDLYYNRLIQYIIIQIKLNRFNKSIVVT